LTSTPTSIKSASYPGEKILKINQNKAAGKRVQNNIATNMKQASTPKTAAIKTLPSSAAATTPTAESTPAKSATPTGKEISQDLMQMLGVTPMQKSPPKESVRPTTTPKAKIIDYGCLARAGSPEKYKEITNDLKLLLKVQA
jgi:hypothetical protein